MSYYTELYEKRKKSRLCVRCGQPLCGSPYVKCMPCYEKSKKHYIENKENYASNANSRKNNNKKNGNCYRCGGPREQQEKSCCNSCLLKAKNTSKVFRARNPEKQKKYVIKTYRRKKEEGVCSSCNSLAVPGFTKCRYHAKKNAEQVKEKRKQWKKCGLCTHCGKEKSEDYLTCNKCRDDAKKLYEKYVSKNLCPICKNEAETYVHCQNCRRKASLIFSAKRSKLLENGLCLCGALLAPNRANCHECLLRSRKYGLRLKKEVLSYYSTNNFPSCCCCREWRLPLLTIDHINVDGAQHRAFLGNNGSRSLYVNLKKNGFPKNMRTMCWNCNIASYHNNGVCPHIAIQKNYSKRHLALKNKVIDFFGNACYCCNETEIKFLSLDHIYGGGRKHRLKLGSSRALYEYALKKGDSNEFRIACFNCNSGRYLTDGICIHEYDIIN